MKKKYIYTFGEELANVTSHGIMAALALLTMPFAIIWIFSKGSLLDAIGVSIFMISIFLMFLASSLYHSMVIDTKHKYLFRIFDHIFIYVAIAGSYTPIALSVIGGWQGITIVCIQWAMVVLGILQKTLSKKSEKKPTVAIYVIMGGTIVMFFSLFLKQASIPLFSLVLAGGVFYTGGVYFFAKKAFKYYHMIWHFFVNMGAIAHFVGIVFFLN